MTRLITATYRLQLRRDFSFSTVRALVPYFDRLGVSHLYLSPVLAARPGSPHGYDVTDPARVNPELGTEDELRALADALHARGMGIVLDIVPNHMAASEQNPHWDDVLQRGRASRFAEWFDIDWDAPRSQQKIVLPVLSDELEAVIERGELTLRIRDSGARVAYHERTFPLDAATLPKEIQLAQLDPAGRPAADAWASGPDGRARFRVMLNAQHYRLVHWRQTKDINYRRFFDVNDLVALRMDTDAVFDETHRLILSWVRDGVVDGLRVDHVDGLRAPSWYLGKLRTAVDAARHPDAPERFPLYVEKILAGDEALPSDWAVDGTTGYDFMNDVEDLFLDESGFGAIEANYRGLRHNPSLGFRAVARDGKRRALTSSLEPDVMRAARVAHAWRPSVSLDDVASAITELIVHLDVYRTYVGEPGVVSETDRPRLEAAFRGAMESEGANRAALELLQSAFFASATAADAQRAELVSRVQLASGPAAAKGIEDTALYVYVPLASRNEVGGEPDRPLGEAAARAHARNTARARDWPGALIATNTHDTKRSGDLRARLDVLTGVPDEWGRHVARWRRLNKPRKRIARGRPAPDTNSEYMFYQALLGVWPAPRPERRADDLPDRAWIAGVCDRLVEYMLKAAREAKTRTSWTESDTQYERALEAFVREALAPSDDAPFLPDVARLTALVADRGFGVSLARLLLHCTAPGCPDFYQGDELWSFTLVDPDNRRPVDFALRARLLESLDAPAVLRAAFAGELALLDPRVKLAAVERLLRFRRDNGTVLASGDYLPILGASAAATGLFAFARRSRHGVCISIARTRMPLPNAQAIEGQSLELPGELAGRWRSIFTGREIELVGKGSSVKVDAGDLVAPRQPCELLLRDNG